MTKNAFISLLLFVLMVFRWLLNELFTLNLAVPQVKVMLPGKHKEEKAEIPALTEPTVLLDEYKEEQEEEV